MKIKRRLGAVAAASLIACTLAVPTLAFAADDSSLDAKVTDEKELTNKDPFTGTNLTGDQDVAVTGTIKATNVKISVPTKSAFNLNPWINGTKTDAQIENPTNFTIKNFSPFAVYAKVSKVAVEATTSNANVKTVNLVDSDSALTANGDVLIALSSETTAPADYTAANFKPLTTTTSSYFTDAANKGVVARGAKSDAGKTEIDTPGEMAMRFYGKAFDNGASGWQAGDSFVLTPTFTFSLKSFA